MNRPWGCKEPDVTERLTESLEVNLEHHRRCTCLWTVDSVYYLKPIKFLCSFYHFFELLCSLELLFVHKDSFAPRVCRHISSGIDVHRLLK